MDDNIHNLRDALEWLDRRIREEAELDGEMSNDHAIQLGFITNILEKFPPRNCDVGTAEEQEERLVEFCNSTDCGRCPHNRVGMDFRGCTLTWAQSHYEADKKGDGDGM